MGSGGINQIPVIFTGTVRSIAEAKRGSGVNPSKHSKRLLTRGVLYFGNLMNKPDLEIGQKRVLESTLCVVHFNCTV